MDNYFALDHKPNYNPQELTARISCRNMGILSENELMRNNQIFVNQFNFDNCEKHNDLHNIIDDVKKKEYDMLKGISINKKSCIYKRPNYGSGDWEDQFNHNTNIHQLFNYQSKAKSNDIKQCHYEMPNNFDHCDKEPYFTYTKTFTNDYYNCVI
jgi:hypothetical protein